MYNYELFSRSEVQHIPNIGHYFLQRKETFFQWSLPYNFVRCFYAIKSGTACFILDLHLVGHVDYILAN